MSLPGGDETFGRKGSFAPNGTVPGEPVQLRFDQFDTAVRDPAKSRGNAVAQAQRRPQPKTFSREWWTKPKIIVAVIVLALLLLLIILLPILLTLNRSTHDSAQDLNSTSLGFGNSTLDLTNLTNWNITDLLEAVIEGEANSSLLIPVLPSTTPPFTETTLTTESTTVTTTPSTTTETTTASTTLSPDFFRRDEDNNATTVILTEKTTRPTSTPSTTTKTTTPSTTTRTTTAVTTVTTTLAPVVLPTIKIPPVANCTGFGFRCASDPNIVIGTNKVCDGRKDCVDGSDEAQCRECQTTFSCPAANDKGMHICLRGDVLCDGTHHCPTGQDEHLHCKAECAPTEYKCEGTNLSGTSTAVTCLPKTYLCDGDAHCKFEDDENNCNRDTCQGGSRWCEPDRRCIAKWHICDGIAHCSDGSDEKGCDCRACSGSDVALCSKDGPLGQCINRDRLCNGHNDCPNGEDEIDCPGFCRLEEAIDTIKCLNGRDYPRRWACSGMIPECEGLCSVCDPELAFTCADQKTRCIPRQQVCDHVKQCADGSDEAPELCSCNNPNTFQCKSPAVADGLPRCIPNIFRCDGYHHCNDGEDEADCDLCFNNPLAFHCKSKRMCFPSASRCDGIIDCPDYSDEDDCPCHVCKSQRYETYMCATKGRCLKRDHVCNSQSQYHCPGTAPEDEMFCTGRQASNLL